MKGKRYIWFVVLCCLTACTQRGLHEAQAVVAEADSLWHEGKTYDDSATLAHAYNELGKWQRFYPDEYAHACYHYGKLLRMKDDHAAAMQCFINATHTRTSDFHILGRVYSNMGSICHLASNFTIAYGMYEKSANFFLQNGDTLNYYYALNDMAYESAERGDSITAIAIVESLENLHESEFPFLTLITRAELSLKRKNYVSAIPYAKKALSLNTNNSVTPLLILAQSYSYLGNKDSAVYYANLVLSNTDDVYNINNALYIITNDDESKDINAVREVAADRSDTQKLIEIQRSKLSQAVQLLEQDLNRKPDLRWVYAIMITALFTGGAFYWRYYIRKRQMRTQVKQMIERQNDNIMQSIKQHIDVNDLTHTLHWKNYAAMKADADLYMGGIVNKLEAQNLNETEIRFCLLTMLDFSLSRIAETIHYGYPSGIKTLKKRISVKLGTTPPQLHDFLFQIASNA